MSHFRKTLMTIWKIAALLGLGITVIGGLPIGGFLVFCGSIAKDSSVTFLGLVIFGMSIGSIFGIVALSKSFRNHSETGTAQKSIQSGYDP